MPFTIRPCRRFPVCCPVTYQTGLFEGHGTVLVGPPTITSATGGLARRIIESFI